MPQILSRIEMLGTLRVVRGPRITTRFRTHKAAALLAFLAHHCPQRHSRELLIDMLWPDMSLESGRSGLSMALSSLRGLLDGEEEGEATGPSVILAGRTTIGLDPERVTTDTGFFEETLTRLKTGGEIAPEDRLRRLEEAVAVYRGELLPGFYQEWIFAERARLQSLCREALMEISSGRLGAGDRAGALEAARRAAALDSLHEETQRTYIRLLLESAQPAAALRQYRSLEERFRKELGAAPHLDTRNLVASLLPGGGVGQKPRRRSASPRSGAGTAAQRPKSLPRPPVFPSLPPRLDRFFGREAEIAEVGTLLAQPGCLVILTGTGGVGKTRLALEVAVAGEGLWEPLFVPLAEVTDAPQLLETLYKTLGLPGHTSGDPLPPLVQRLSRGSVLLVLDNFEQIAREGALLVRELVHRTPTLRCLVTSRSRLQLDLEQEVALAPLPSPPREEPVGAGELSALQQHAGVALFLDRCRSSAPGFALTPRNAASVVRLVEDLEGLPLALELTAARAAVLTPRQMLEALHRRPFDLLSGRRTLSADRHHSLRDTVAWSYDLLPADLQRFFRRLAVFHSGWTLEAAEAVADSPLALDQLAQLQAASLVRTVTGQDEDSRRFSMLVTLRAYALEQLGEGPEALEALERHAAYFAALASQAAAKMHGPKEDLWLQRLHEEQDNLRAALAISMASPNGYGRGLAMASDLWWFWCAFGYWQEGETWLERALNVEDAERIYTLIERAHALKALGHLRWMRRGSPEVVRPLLEESQRLYEAAGDPHGLAELLIMREDDPALMERGLAICRAASYENLLPVAMQGAAGHAWRRGDSARAESLYAEGAGLLRRRGDIRLVGLLCEWAYMLLWRGEYRRSAALLEEALIVGVGQTVDTFSHAAWILGSVHLILGNYPQARMLVEGSAARRREFGAGQALGSTLVTLGTIALVQGDFEEAHVTLAEAERVVEAIEWSMGRSYVRCAQGRLALYKNQNEIARSLYTERRDYARTQQDALVNGMACCGLGWLAVGTQDWQAAASAFSEGLRCYNTLGNERGKIECVQGLACAAAGDGAWERAAQLLGRLQVWCETSGAVVPPLERVYCDRAAATARQALGEPLFTAALTAGREMPLPV